MTDRTLEVYYRGRRVGTLAETKDKRICFEYSGEWLKSGFSISPFSLPLQEGLFLPKTSSREVFRGLFGVFADSLPDAWGNLLLDRYLSSIGINDLSVLDRLAYVGDSGMGALEYKPSNHIDYSFEGMDYDVIAAECRKVLSSKESDQLDVLFGLGGSSGGTRPKILVTENGRHWIVKFPSGIDPKNSGEMEYEYSVCAKKCGIHMTETGLISSKTGGGYFKTERFDRKGTDKIFCITFAGILEADYRAPVCDYQDYMKLIRILTKENEAQLEQMFRTMCFNVFAHNLDDHAKNFSFLYDDDRGWHLAPAYDLTYSNTYYGEHTTSVNSKGRDVTEDDLIKVGVNAGLKKADCLNVLTEVRQEIAASRLF